MKWASKRRSNRCRRRRSAVSRVGVTPLEQADGYATLASGGIHHDPTAISRVEFPNGKVDETDPDEGERVLTEGQAYEVTQDPRGRDHPGHRRRLHLHGLRRRGRQDRHLGGPVRRLVRRLHAALLDRGLGRPPAVARSNRLRRSRPPARSGAPSWNRPSAGNCPEFPNRRACPNSPGLSSGHTSGSASSSPSESEFNEFEEEEEEGARRRTARAKATKNTDPHLNPKRRPNRPRSRHPPPNPRRRLRPRRAAASRARTDP